MSSTDHMNSVGVTSASDTSVDRWKPHRLGIAGLWDYADEILTFHDGRLVLRGANGSGKTKALELSFPFLFDASLAAQRLDPFSGEGRTMKQNLLYRGDRDSSYGYVWMEFRRGEHEAEHEAEQCCTIGAGLQAHRQRDSVSSWYFVAEGSVGTDFSVTDDERRPLTRKQLREELGEANVYDTARDYRRRVDHELFGLGDDRYDALVQLVLFLRRPHLARDLDLPKLSGVLSEGLRPIDDDLLDEAARSFEDLEVVQGELDDLEHSVEAVERFLGAHRSYARVMARHRVDIAIDCRKQVRICERAQRDLGHQTATAAGERSDAKAQVESFDDELRRARHTREALLASPAYRSVEQLGSLEGRVSDAEDEIADLVARESGAATRIAGFETDLDAARADLDAAEAQVDDNRRQLLGTAEAAGIEWAVPDDDDPEASHVSIDRAVTALATARSQDLTAVRSVLRDHERALVAADDASAAVDAAQERVEAEEQAGAEAAATLGRAREELRIEILAWHRAASVLHEPDLDLDDIAESLTDAVAEVEFGRELTGRLDTLLADRRQSLAVGRAAAERDMAEAGERLEELAETRQRVAEEGEDEPPVPAVRTAARDKRAGAPLWRLVDFADSVQPVERPMLEAALEASGLLDAWVTPDGVIPADVADTFVGHGAAVEGPTLAAVLVPEPDAGVPVELIGEVLSSVGLDEVTGGGLVIRPDGSWRFGHLGGAGAKEHASYIGATARAERRRRRLDELDAAIAVVQAERSRGSERVLAVDETVAALDAAVATFPATARLDGAVQAGRRAAAAFRAAVNAHDDAVARADEARRRAADTRRAFHDAAAVRGLPTDADALDAVEAAIARFRTEGGELVRSLERRGERIGRCRRVADQLDAASGELETIGVRLRRRRHERSGLAAELDTLRSSIGDEAETIMARLSEVEGSVDKLEQQLEEAREREATARETAARVAAELDAATARLADVQKAAAAALDQIDILRHRDLRTAVGVELDSGADLVAVTDALDAATEGVSASEERRKAATTGITNAFTRLQGDLGSRQQPALDQVDGILMVTITDQSGPQRVTAFADTLTARRDDQALLLSTRERQVFEDTLLATLGGQLHARIREAHAQVRSMNASLADRATSSGITMALGWEVPDDADEQVREITKLLDRDPQLAGADTRSRLRDQFADRIRAARAADSGIGYREVLARSLDYRQWRHFVPRISRDGQTRTLNRREFNKLSGGEKATALHLPLFAAAAAHYSSADPGAPRLVALDEAFAGIDNDTVERLMSLSVEFDLDLFLTGHDLWGTFRGVPGVSIYELVHVPEAHAVHAEHMWWDGNELHLRA